MNKNICLLLLLLNIIVLLWILKKNLGNLSSEGNNNSSDTISDVPTTELALFNVVLIEVGVSKINVVKVVNDILNLGLKATKELVESAPVTIKEKVTKEVAEEIKTKLEEVGAKVEIQ